MLHRPLSEQKIDSWTDLTVAMRMAYAVRRLQDSSDRWKPIDVILAKHFTQMFIDNQRELKKSDSPLNHILVLRTSEGHIIPTMWDNAMTNRKCVGNAIHLLSRQFVFAWSDILQKYGKNTPTMKCTSIISIREIRKRAPYRRFRADVIDMINNDMTWSLYLRVSLSGKAKIKRISGARTTHKQWLTVLWNQWLTPDAHPMILDPLSMPPSLYLTQPPSAAH